MNGRGAGTGPLLLVLTAVVMNVTSAVVMKFLAARAEPPLILLAGGLALVVALHGARLVVWGACHKKYPLSGAYPLSALFFPLMLPVAMAFGEPVGLAQYAGAALICAGAFWLTLRAEDDAPEVGP